MQKMCLIQKQSFTKIALRCKCEKLQSQIKSKCEEWLITQIVYSVMILSKTAYVAQTKRKQQCNLVVILFSACFCHFGKSETSVLEHNQSVVT